MYIQYIIVLVSVEVGTENTKNLLIFAKRSMKENKNKKLEKHMR